jgi:multiple sugar transport system permease protein
LGVSIIVSSSIWSLLLNPNDGLVNSVIALFGIPQQPFLTSTTQALWCIILVASWTGISYWMIFILAGLQEIPDTLYEAAIIDGANAWQTFWRITLPSLRRVLLFVIVADTSANFLLFAPIYVLTGGGPQMSTNSLMHEIYSSAFIYSDIHRALTLTAILLTLLLGFILVEFKMFGKEN